MCDLHMHMYRYDRAEAVLTLFRSISYAVESQIQTANKRIGNRSCRILNLCVAASPRHPDLTACSSGNQDSSQISC
jgi:hypothetical protein